MTIVPRQRRYSDSSVDLGVLRLLGDWDLANDTLLTDLLQQLRSCTQVAAVVDVSGVTFLGVRSMLMLLDLSGELRDEGRTLALRGATDGLQRQLRLLLTCALPLRPSTLLFV